MAARIIELRAERDALVKRANDALDKIRASAKADKRRFTAAEMAEQDGFDEELKALDADLDLEERVLARERSTPTPVLPERHEDPKDPRSATPGMPPPENDPNRFRSMGEFLQKVHLSGTKGPMFTDRRLLAPPMAGPSGMDESVDSEGGFLVQTDWGGTLMALVWDTGILTPKVKKAPIGDGKSGVKYNLLDETSRLTGSRYGGIQVYWAAEADAATGTKPKFRRLELRLEKLLGFLYGTDELLEDATALEGFVNQWFPEEFAFMLDDAIVNGTGAGIPLGILKSPALVTIAKEAGQQSGTIVAANLEKMFAAMPARCLADAEWYINVACWPSLFQLSHPIGTAGVPVFLPPGGLSNAPFGTIFGRPIVPIEQAQALGTPGDIFLASLPWYIMADKGGIKSASSIHVKFLSDEQAFRWTLRTDGKPIPSAPITPYKGAQPLSPFVCLAQR